MFVKNNLFYQVGEVFTNFKTHKKAVEVLGWENQESVFVTEPKLRKLCILTIPNWNENSYNELDSLVSNSDQSLWKNFSREDALSAIEPDKTLEELKKNKSEQIRIACGEDILNGFYSNALGGNYLYPSNDKDQVNLSATIQRSLLPTSSEGEVYLFLCMSESGEWSYLPHSAAQIQRVGADGYQNILNARLKNSSLQALINQAQTTEELDAIEW